MSFIPNFKQLKDKYEKSSIAKQLPLGQEELTFPEKKFRKHKYYISSVKWRGNQPQNVNTTLESSNR